ncbi:MAG: DUF4388 domain-containing protein [Ktedonobacteraceae bacterium]|nr:DUF4388 domain-containing protein [Ktedonobacteraceae bacterium]
MAKGRDTMVGSLGEVLELFRVRRQSGLLSIEHPRNGWFEEGEVYVHIGQPIYAYAGQMPGPDALSWMLNWRQIRFAFFVDTPRPTPNLPVTGTLNAVGVNFASAALIPANYTQVNTDALDISRGANEAGGYPGVAAEDQDYRPGLEWLTPQRLNVDHDVLSMPLTRRQRSIYLLVDGKRTISDLARCVRKSVPEVESILRELQGRGLLKI